MLKHGVRAAGSSVSHVGFFGIPQCERPIAARGESVLRSTLLAPSESQDPRSHML